MISIILLTGCGLKKPLTFPSTTIKQQNTGIDHMNLPEYVTFDPHKETEPAMLKTPAQEFKFPLNSQDMEEIGILEAKYDQEKNCAGLAGPQIGISKKMIVFAVEDSEELRAKRNDLIQTIPKTIWLNASYKPANSEITIDGEGCFSVDDIAADVPRYHAIEYTAYDYLAGREIAGKAEGFLARVIQHEIDHTNGILFIDRVKKEDWLSKEEYKKRKVVEYNKDKAQ